MKLATILAAVMLAMAVPAAADSDDDEEARLDIAGDVFRAGQQAVHGEGTADDLFLAGETVRSTAPVSDDAHALGRWVTLEDEIGGDLYAAGMTVTVEAPVRGDANLAGYEMSVAEVGGDLRATASRLEVDGPVAGYALLTVESLTLNAAVAGDAHVMARKVEFGPDARIDGTLVLYEARPGRLEVPESVAPPDRIERREVNEWEGGVADMHPFSWGELILRYLAGLVIVAGLAALAAALMPRTLAEIRKRLLDRPARALWLGFLAQSALVGATVILALSILGIFFSPAVALLAGLVGFGGYVVASYALGVGLLRAFGRPLPARWSERAAAGAVGAALACLLALVPFLGWIFVLALTLAGVGAAVAHVFRPRFFV